jgi:hypothetical protein
MNLLPMSIFFLLNFVHGALPKTFNERSAISKSRYLFLHFTTQIMHFGSIFQHPSVFAPNFVVLKR